MMRMEVSKSTKVKVGILLILLGVWLFLTVLLAVKVGKLSAKVDLYREKLSEYNKNLVTCVHEVGRLLNERGASR